MKPQKLIRAVLAAILIPVGLYLGTAAVLGHVPVNPGWREPAREEPGVVTIYVQSNGVHTGIVIPTGLHGWQAFGWGDRTFYVSTPRWQDVKAATVLSALIGSEDTVIHVEELRDFLPDENWRALRVRPDEYSILRRFITRTLLPGGKAIAGYSPDDRFYPARGRYSALVTCNVWTSRALKAAGIRTGFWTPFAGDVMRWVPLR